MVTRKQECWIQCQECGHIYYIEKNVPVDELYVASVCPRCESEKGLNCGRSKDDVYLYANINVDPRYYQY